MNDKIFSDIGKTFKKIAKVIFSICVVCGVILIIIGSIKFLMGIDKYTTFSDGITCTLEDASKYSSLYKNCYWGKQIFKIGLIGIISALGMLPLYAFGEIISCIKKIEETLSEINDSRKK